MSLINEQYVFQTRVLDDLTNLSIPRLSLTLGTTPPVQNQPLVQSLRILDPP
jgi:hypothetical protein